MKQNKREVLGKKAYSQNNNISKPVAQDLSACCRYFRNWERT